MRPTKFSDELFENICNQIATTSIGLHKICKQEGISAVTFFEWVKDDTELSNRYTRAREAQAELLADQIIEIADDSSNDTKTIYKGEELVEVENTEWTNRSKLRVEARKWIAAKLKPKKYGDKVEVDQTISVNKLPDWLSNDLIDTTKELKDGGTTYFIP